MTSRLLPCSNHQKLHMGGLKHPMGASCPDKRRANAVDKSPYPMILPDFRDIFCLQTANPNCGLQVAELSERNLVELRGPTLSQALSSAEAH